MGKILVKQAGAVQQFQSVGGGGKPGIKQLWNRMRNDPTASGWQKINAGLGLAGKGAALAGTAFTTANQLQGGNITAPLGAGYTYAGLDPTGGMIGEGGNVTPAEQQAAIQQKDLAASKERGLQNMTTVGYDAAGLASGEQTRTDQQDKDLQALRAGQIDPRQAQLDAARTAQQPVQQPPTNTGTALPGSQGPTLGSGVQPQQPQQTQVPPGQVPPGQVPPGQVSPGQVSPGQVPPGQMGGILPEMGQPNAAPAAPVPAAPAPAGIQQTWNPDGSGINQPVAPTPAAPAAPSTAFNQFTTPVNPLPAAPAAAAAPAPAPAAVPPASAAPAPAPATNEVPVRQPLRDGGLLENINFNANLNEATRGPPLDQRKEGGGVNSTETTGRFSPPQRAKIEEARNVANRLPASDRTVGVTPTPQAPAHAGPPPVPPAPPTPPTPSIDVDWRTGDRPEPENPNKVLGGSDKLNPTQSREPIPYQRGSKTQVPWEGREGSNTTQQHGLPADQPKMNTDDLRAGTGQELPNFGADWSKEPVPYEQQKPIDAALASINRPYTAHGESVPIGNGARIGRELPRRETPLSSSSDAAYAENEKLRAANANMDDWRQDPALWFNKAFVDMVFNEFGDLFHKADPDVVGSIVMGLYLDRMVK